MTCAVRIRKRGRGKSKASHHVSALSHFALLLVALGVPGASALEAPFATCFRPEDEARKSGVEMEAFKLFAERFRLLMLLEGERNGMTREGECALRF